MKVLSIIISIVLVVSFTSCDRDEEIQGPVYKTSDLTVQIIDNQFFAFKDTSKVELAENQPPVFGNLQDTTQKDTVFFYAELTELTTWKITISGESSGAVKELVGTSKIIDFPFWNGISDNEYFFRKKEKVSVVLSLIGSNVSQSLKLEVGGVPVFPGMILIGDFEEGDDIQGLVKATAGDSDGWFQFFDVEGDDEEISYGLGPNKIIYNQPSKASIPVKSIQGNSYFHLRGDDNSVKPSPFFIGGFGHDAVTYGLPDKPLNEIFINFYANSNGNRTTKLVVELAGINGDLFTKEIGVDWDGWKLISVRLSDFVLTTAGDTGIGKLLPTVLKQMKFAIHSGGTAGNIAEINIDYVNFTINSPFKQK